MEELEETKKRNSGFNYPFLSVSKETIPGFVLLIHVVSSGVEWTRLSCLDWTSLVPLPSLVANHSHGSVRVRSVLIFFLCSWSSHCSIKECHTLNLANFLTTLPCFPWISPKVLYILDSYFIQTRKSKLLDLHAYIWQGLWDNEKFLRCLANQPCTIFSDNVAPACDMIGKSTQCNTRIQN